MAFIGYKEGSRTNWGTEQSGALTLDQIKAGAILRIADATEAMAKQHTSLLNDRDYWKRRAESAEGRLGTERRRTAALRGWIKRQKAR